MERGMIYHKLRDYRKATVELRKATSMDANNVQVCDPLKYRLSYSNSSIEPSGATAAVHNSQVQQQQYRTLSGAATAG
jgi:hypothetical protein